MLSMALALAVLACRREPEPEVDRDGDGYAPASGDCDDDNPDVHPGADDPAGDGVDADCDGGDASSRGIASAPGVSGYQQLQFGHAIAVADLDNDGADDMIIGTQHVRYDAGEGAAFRYGGDLALQARWDGGFIDAPGATQPVYAGSLLGQYLDVAWNDGDTPMVLIGDAQGVWVLPANAPSGHPFTVAAGQLYRDPDSYLPSQRVRAADLLGDGAEDVAIQCGTGEDFNAYTGHVCVYAGPIVGTRSMGEPDAVLAEGLNSGSSIAAADLDGDGLSDLAAGADREAEQAGRMFAYLGPLPEGGVELAAGEADAAWTGEGPGDWFGHDAYTGDLDGNGVDELLVTALAWPGASRVGKVYALGLDTPTVADAAWTVEGDSFASFVGAGLAVGDFDGDGQADVAIGAPSLPSLDASVPGRALVYLGPLSGQLGTADADLSYAGELPGDALGMEIAAGDLDGDGAVDLVLAATYNDLGGEDAGRVYVLHGPLAP